MSRERECASTSVISVIDKYLAIRIDETRSRDAGQRGDGHQESNAANRELHDVGVGIACRDCFVK
jgi:hypothetical protein